MYTFKLKEDIISFQTNNYSIVLSEKGNEQINLKRQTNMINFLPKYGE